MTLTQMFDVGVGLYAAGWVATGPVGVILSTMSNAFDTANRVMQDLSSGAVNVSEAKPGAAYILNLLRSKGTTSFSKLVQ